MFLKKLKEIYLNENNISDIKILKKVNFENLEQLSLNDNLIDEIKSASIISNLKAKIKVFHI